MADNIVYDQMDVNASADAWDDEELIKMYDRATAMAHEKVHRQDKSKETSKDGGRGKEKTWKVGDTCMALYAEDGKCYPAKIIGIDIVKKQYEVLYTEYDEKAVVSADELYRLPLDATAGLTSSDFYNCSNESSVVGESWRSNSSFSTSWKTGRETSHSYHTAAAWCQTLSGVRREETWKNIHVESTTYNVSGQRREEDWRRMSRSDSCEPVRKHARYAETTSFPNHNFHSSEDLNESAFVEQKSDEIGEIWTSAARIVLSPFARRDEMRQKQDDVNSTMNVSFSVPRHYSVSVLQQLSDSSLSMARKYEDGNHLRPVSLLKVFDMQADGLLQQMAGSCVNSLRRATLKTKKLRFDSITYTQIQEKRSVCRSLTVTAGRFYEFGSKKEAITPKMYDDGASMLKLYLETVCEKLGQLPGCGLNSNDADLSEDEVEWTDDDGAAESGPSVSITANGNKETFPIPDLCPPPPPSLFGKVAQAGNNKEALTNMLMSWYMSGYHTGFYQGMQKASASSKRSSNR